MNQEGTKSGHESKLVRLLVMALFLGAFPQLVASPAALAVGVETTPSTLPVAMDGTGSIWTGSYAFFFGGGQTRKDIYFDDILRFDPATGSVTTMTASLPSARQDAATIWTGTYAFIFGGRSASGRLDEIVRYDPATDTLSTMTAELPVPVTGAAAVWYDGSAYIFGGETSPGASLDQILRYDPVDDEITAMAAALPYKGHGMAAVAVDTFSTSNPPIILIGGTTDPVTEGGAILGYDPETDSIAVRDAKLPSRTSASAAAIGSHVFVFGGFLAGSLPEIYEYSVLLDRLVALEVTLPTPRSSTSAFFDGDDIYVVGGFEFPNETGKSRSIDDIVRFDMTPRSPILSPPLCETLACIDHASLFWANHPLSLAELYAMDGISNADSFRVYRAELTGPFVLVYETDGGPYDDYPPATGAYRYRVTGVNQFGEGTPSNEVAILIVAPHPDQDGDRVADASEPEICAHQNTALRSDGTCVGDDYTPPGPDDVIADLLWLLDNI